jgi:hypothetical protein
MVIEARGNSTPHDPANWSYSGSPDDYLFFNSKRFEYRKMNGSIEVNFDCACRAFYKPIFACKGLLPADSIMYSISNPNNLSTSQGNLGNLLYAYTTYSDFNLTLISGLDNHIKFFTYAGGIKKEYNRTFNPLCLEFLSDTIYYD